jgi:protein transport protein SEC31
MFEENARSALLNHLGFSLPEVKENKLEEISGETGDLNAQMSNFTLTNGTSETIDEKSSSLGPSDFLVQQADTVDDGADFFNNLSTPKAGLSPKVLTSIEAVNTEATTTHEEAHDDGLDDEDENDRAVHHALTVGNFKDAVKQCLLANRMADALVLAHVGGAALWDETLTEYLRKHRRPYRKV